MTKRLYFSHIVNYIKKFCAIFNYITLVHFGQNKWQFQTRFCIYASLMCVRLAILKVWMPVILQRCYHCITMDRWTIDLFFFIFVEHLTLFLLLWWFCLQRALHFNVIRCQSEQIEGKSCFLVLGWTFPLDNKFKGRHFRQFFYYLFFFIKCWVRLVSTCASPHLKTNKT